ncbi:MAG: hypothetical protein ABH811_00990 [archaeon]
MKKGYYIEDNTLVINRELTELDLFVKDFLEILKKHSDYLIVSGYVSISTGRTRATEDVGILVPIMDEENFRNLFQELQQNNFWCYQGDTSEKAYSYIKDIVNIRFARVNEMFPNMEMVFINENRMAKYYEFTHPQKIKIKDFEFKIPPLEFEILYKEIILAGKKDFEDAKHLRILFSDVLKEEKFKECGRIIRGELNK